ncbi:hypothetical protein GCM10023333_12620 [Ferrimonas pelagia]|uniref:Uncharacterized protein n=2 Tax=Ferrimonas pelagia TaxID=1177826 RepID=A0ABP9EK57_9GAMM
MQFTSNLGQPMEELVRQLLVEMAEGKHDDNAIVLGLGHHLGQPLQLQLIVTTAVEDFLDE